MIGDVRIWDRRDWNRLGEVEGLGYTDIHLERVEQFKSGLA